LQSAAGRIAIAGAFREPSGYNERWKVSFRKGALMAKMTMPKKKESTEDDEPFVKGQTRPQEKRFLLKIDSQTKASFDSEEEAQKAGKAIKKAFPVVRVKVYDSKEHAETLVD